MVIKINKYNFQGFVYLVEDEPGNYLITINMQTGYNKYATRRALWDTYFSFFHESLVSRFNKFTP